MNFNVAWKRMFLLAVMFTLVASGTYAQVRGAGKGITKGTATNQLSLVPTSQYITYTYPWNFAPVGTSNGWYVSQSTSGGVTIAAEPPFLMLTGATANRRVMISEGGATLGVQLGSVSSVSSDGEVTIQVALYNMDQIGGATTPWFQLAYGDTTNFVNNKKPNGDGFGVIVTGSTSANNAYAQANTLTGYVAGNSDTTYAPITATGGLTNLKLVIHADPGGGPVTFWVNGILKATISSPVRGPTGSSMTTLWLNGGASLAPVGVGPLTIQRAWP